MPRRAKGARLWLRPEDTTGATKRASVWIIRDREKWESTGCAPHEIERAEKALAAYIEGRHTPSRANARDPDQIPVADVLSIYLSDVVENHARPKETKGRIRALTTFWGHKTLADVIGRTCREYVAARSTPAAARRELEDLRSAIRHHREEGLCSQVVEVVLPERSPGRQRWLTRSEAARLLWAAYHYREVQKGVETDRRSRRHLARFILIALYTGTRSAAICGAALEPTEGCGWIDLERGVFFRRAEGVRETKKRQPPVRLPDRLLAHLRRWKDKGIATRFAVEFGGEPVKRITKAFARTVKAAGLEGVTPHVLRHTAVTWALQNRADPREAAGFFGMTLEMLDQRYGHHSPDHQVGVADAVTKSPKRSSRVKESTPDAIVNIVQKIVEKGK